MAPCYHRPTRANGFRDRTDNPSVCQQTRMTIVDYPFHVFVAVLGAAAMHATWNAWVRGGSNPLLHTTALVIWTGVFAVPFILVLPLPHRASWPLLALSIAIHVVYYLTLSRAYAHGALSVVYPIMRGMAPLMVSLGTWAFLDEAPGAMGWLGVVLISLGVLGVAFKASITEARTAIGWALACSTTIAIYTIVDGQGARLSQNSISFTAWLFLLEALVFAGLLTLAGQAKALGHYVRARLGSTAMGGLLSAAGYATVLWAMTQAPMAMVSATRETSVLFAALLGVWLLKERLMPLQWVGAMVIVTGLVTLRL